MMKKLLLLLGAFLPCFFMITKATQAQQTGTITGKVINLNKKVLAGVNILVSNGASYRGGTATDADGQFKITEVPVGSQHIRFTFVGFQKKFKTVTVKAAQTTRVNIQLSLRSVQLRGITVSTLQPDLSISSMEKTDIRRADPEDPGELMRNLQGVNAVRRGPVGLDPVVRGLRETEVGTYLDGTRIFPGGPARMDSPLSHLDPSSIQTIDVVKGPYTLTWGAGNMTAVRVETQPLTTLRKPFGGTLSSGYDTNTNSLKEVASLRGTSGNVGYWVHGAWRKGQDYKSVSGMNIPANFLSRGLRGKVGYKPTADTYFDVSLGYQNQRNIDYPGRLLNADYFRTYNGALHWSWTPDQSVLKKVKASIYRNEVHHHMDNNGKPTGQPAPNRKPPFALHIGVKAHAYVTGGRVFADLLTGNSWNWKIGADVYDANRNAVRIIDKKENGMHLFTDLMWPDATIVDGGVYTKLSHSFTDRLQASGTVRLDLVRARADTSSQFFKENVGTNLDSNEANINGALTLSYVPVMNWKVGLSVGSVARTADATERYSARTPASKAQTSAEFVGNMQLDPERNTQADLWVRTGHSLWNLKINGFIRYMGNYITIRPTDLPKRLPLSPSTVYQYVNGSGRYYGFDVLGAYRFIPEFTLQTGLSYLHGQDTKLDEPALGVSPFNADVGLRYEPTWAPLFVRGVVHFVNQQTRVATVKGETPTDGYITQDIELGGTIFHRLSVQAGIKNISDREYVNHLNAKNPFTSQPIPEPGRVFHFDLQYNF